MIKPLFCFTCFLFFFSFLPHLAIGGESSVVAPSFWKPNDMWQIDAEWFPEKGDKAGKATKFSLYAIVAKEVKVTDKNCWQTTLAAVNELPDDSDFVMHISIDKTTGWPVKAVELNGEWEGKFISFGKQSVLAKPLEFFPAELFGVAEPGEFLAGPHRLVVTRERSGSQTKVGVALFELGAEQWRIAQTWKDGDLFWTSYERHVKGRLALRATGKVFKLADRTDAEKKAIGMIAIPLEKNIPLHPLYQDKRLLVLVKLEPAQPSVTYVLQQIKAASGVELEIAPDLAKHAPDLRGIAPGVDAIQVMGLLAKIEIKDARWEKTGSGGYRLHGVSTVPPGRVLVTPGQKTASPDPKVAPSVDAPTEPTPRPFPWLLTSGGVILVLIAIAVVAVILVRRRVPVSNPNGSAAKTATKKKPT